MNYQNNKTSLKDTLLKCIVTHTIYIYWTFHDPNFKPNSENLVTYEM